MANKKLEISNSNLTPAINFALPMIFAPLFIISWFTGGWFILAAPFFGYIIVTIFDFLLGENLSIPEPKEINLTRYKIILFAWPFIQFFLIFGSLIAIFFYSHLSSLEAILMLVVQGMITGAVGITFAHELMHQKSKKERFLADFLMGMAVYGHFRTEHLHVHHRFVGTDKDAVTAKFNEGFYSFFLRISHCCVRSAWMTEKERLSRLGKSWSNRRNPFWIYVSLPFVFIFLAFFIGGLFGIALFLLQAFVAILHLEVVNYIEHYGLTRAINSDGKYEPTRPHHSWNSNQKASNLLLINLQKHSDHHTNPSKVYPLIQPHSATSAPQLPFGYPIMVVLSLVPPLWKKVMNPKVLQWRRTFYPEIKKWAPTP